MFKNGLLGKNYELYTFDINSLIDENKLFTCRTFANIASVKLLPALENYPVIHNFDRNLCERDELYHCLYINLI